MKILVTGSSGQLGQSFKKYGNKELHDFIYADRETLDITSRASIKEAFEKHQPDILINCAAYTAVDQAEDEEFLAYKINTKGPRHLAKACQEHGVLLIHFSTDYVYHIDPDRPLKEDDLTQPQGVYAETKRNGEVAIEQSDCPYIILRVSWLYSEFGNNFMKTMLRLSEKHEQLSIVSDQIGCPTYAGDVVDTIERIIQAYQNDTFTSGIYNYSGAGKISWDTFAAKIFELANAKTIVNPITTAEYPTKATRPLWSVMDMGKIHDDYAIFPVDWDVSLAKAMKEYRQKK